MKAFARFTAVIFMILGLLIILGGVVFAFFGAFIQTPAPTVPSLIPNMTGLIFLARIVGGSAIGLQGLFLAAIGQVLWLLAGIYEETQITSETLASLQRRANQPRQ